MTHDLESADQNKSTRTRWLATESAKHRETEVISVTWDNLKGSHLDMSTEHTTKDQN